MKMNVKLQIYKISQYLADHGLDPEVIDVSAEIDRTLSLPENIKNISELYGVTIEKEPGADDYCLFLQEKCELECDAESCEMFNAEKCAGAVEPCPAEKEGRGKIFCYRDLLIYEDIEEEMDAEEDDEFSEYKKRKGRSGQHPGYGVTLYFIEGMFGAKKPAGVSIIFLIMDLIAGKVKPDKAFDVGREIEKILSKNAPIVSFVRMCINAGTGKTRCYDDARAAGVAIRKQTQLALYEFLKGESSIKMPEITPGAIPPAFGFFESIRDFFRDELSTDPYFGQFEYIESDLSECDAGDISTAVEIDAGDFVFEMGELQSATIKYFGHYHSQRKKLVCRIYPEFNQSGLKALLVKR
jgi:hypothetical protein